MAPAALAFFFAVLTALLYVQISSFSRLEAEARRLQWRAKGEEDEVWERLVNNVVLPEAFATINRLRGVSFTPGWSRMPPRGWRSFRSAL